MERLASETYLKDLQQICGESLPFEKLHGTHILLTGATGLIGSCLADTLMYLKKTRQIPMKLDILCRKKQKADQLFQTYKDDKDFRILEGDLTKPVAIEDSYDYIIHGAGNNHPVAFTHEPVETMKTALIGTMNLLDSLVRQNTKDSVFLLLSSGEVYGTLDSMNPRNCYPESKRAAETLCAAYGKEYGIHTKIARLCYVFGATYQEESTKADVQFLKKAAAGQNIVMKSKGEQYRSYCYLSDAVTGILYILLKGKNNDVYNVSNLHSNVTIRQFAETLAETAGVSVDFELPEDSEKQGYSPMKEEILDAGKLQILGYQPKVSLQEAFHRILKIKKEI